jgi:quercetin dioxygenase-like cupin family protein
MREETSLAASAPIRSPMKLYNWSKVAKERVSPLASRQIIYADAMTVIRRRYRKGALTGMHRHAEEQLCMVQRGSLRVIVDGHEQRVTAGDTLIIPSNVTHSVEALENTVVIDLFPRAQT